MKDFLKKLKVLALSSTSHGIPNMFRTKNRIVRTMWLLFFIGSLTYCVYTITKSAVEYSKYKTTVSIERIQEIPVKFPSITFCNLSPYDQDEARYIVQMFNTVIYKPECLDLYRNGTLKMLKKCRDTNDLVDIVMCKAVNDKLNPCFKRYGYNTAQTKRFMANFITDDIYVKEELGVDLFTEMMHDCKFNNGGCDYKSFTRFWSHEYGNCYTFNAGDEEIGQVVQKGFNTGLEMRLILRTTHKEIGDFTSNRGLYLVVHNDSTLPFTLNNGIYLTPGFSTYIGVDRVMTKKLPSPYSDCIDEFKTSNPYTERLFGFFRDLNIPYYDQDVCFNLCQQDKLIDQCNCSDTITPTIRNAQYCWTFDEMFVCRDSFYARKLTNDFKKYCKDACPPRCITIDYDLQVNNAFFATLSTMNYLKSYLPVFKNIPGDADTLLRFGQQSLLNVYINYRNTYYTLVEDNPSTTFETFLGSIGGQLGLFIGISFLSLIELLELAIEFCYFMLVKRKTTIQPSPT